MRRGQVGGGTGCWREGRRSEGGSEIRARQAGGAGGEGRRGGRETPMLIAMEAWLCTEACQWLLAFTLY